MAIAPTQIGIGRARKRNLFTHVVEELGIRIVRGDLKPNEAFPNEADLGREFGASRSVIREAVKSLAAKGLIESRTRTGIRVLAPMHWNLLDVEVLAWRYSAMPPAQFYHELFEIRLMIEPEAAFLAAQRASQKQIDAISEAYEGMAAASAAGASGTEKDLAFHRGILAAAQNPLLLQMGNLIAVGLYISHRISSESYTVFLPLHKKVLDAIAKRSPEAARRAMHKLLAETLEFVSGHLRKPAEPARQRSANAEA
jgi:GntR family transcriptional regulator, galactonate operon transcriptional repressor